MSQSTVADLTIPSPFPVIIVTSRIPSRIHFEQKISRTPSISRVCPWRSMVASGSNLLVFQL